MSRCIVHVTLVVRDYDEALRFFMDRLDFELVEDTQLPEAGKRWVVVRPRGGEGASLLLARASDERQAAAVGNQAGGRVGLFLHTDDFRGDFRRFEARGVRFVRAPAEMPYGTVAVFEDLYGNRWDLVEYAGRSGRADRDAGPGDAAVRLEANAPVNDAALRVVALTPTPQLREHVDDGFLCALDDAHLMRLAALLAEKSYREGGCPIGAVIVDNASRRIVGKGHNTLVQESHPYNHGETAAMRDAGRIDFSRTTLFTSLSPCDVCTALILQRGFPRVVVGDVTNASGNESVLRGQGVEVEILEDQQGVELYARFRAERPELELEDWRGLSAVRAVRSSSAGSSPRRRK